MWYDEPDNEQPGMSQKARAGTGFQGCARASHSWLEISTALKETLDFQRKLCRKLSEPLLIKNTPSSPEGIVSLCPLPLHRMADKVVSGPLLGWTTFN